MSAIKQKLYITKHERGGTPPQDVGLKVFNCVSIKVAEFPEAGNSKIGKLEAENSKGRTRYIPISTRMVERLMRLTKIHMTFILHIHLEIFDFLLAIKNRRLKKKLHKNVWP